MKQSHVIIALAIVGIALAVVALRRNEERFEGVEMAGSATRSPWSDASRVPNNGARPVQKTLVIVRTYRGKALVKQSNIFVEKGQAAIMQRNAYLKLKKASRGYPTFEEFIKERLLKVPNMFDGYRQLLACAQYRIEKTGMVLPQQMKTEPGLRFMVTLRQAFESMGWGFKVMVVA